MTAAALALLLGASGAAAGDLPALVARVSGAVVVVEAVTAEGSRTGSGFFLERRGLVATALHTVAGARRLRVAKPGRFSASDARLLAASSAWDIAVLEVAWPAEVPYPGLPLDAALLPPGAEVALTGHGSLDGEPSAAALTLRGIVSGCVEHRDSCAYALDVAAREGFSGSPVYRTDSGAVAGILTRVHSPSGSSGPGGAAPSKVLEALVSRIDGSAAPGALLPAER